MRLLTSVHDHYGIYIGQDSALILVPEFTAVFLRLTEAHIVTALMKDGHVAAVVSGHREGRERHVFAMMNTADQRFIRPANALDELTALKRDFAVCTVSFTEEGAMCTLSGQAFPLTLGDPINPDSLLRPQPFDERLSLADRMRAWNVNSWYIPGEKGDTITCNIGNGHYDCHWQIILPENFIYCRLGVSGYCEKGWAMLPTVQLRAHACGMLPDHRDALLPYQPDETCFIPDGCAFPEDGGWYWSVRDVTEDRITLNGCGGDTYYIHRPR